jgi:uncharacterized protein
VSLRAKLARMTAPPPARLSGGPMRGATRGEGEEAGLAAAQGEGDEAWPTARRGEGEAGFGTGEGEGEGAEARAAGAAARVGPAIEVPASFEAVETPEGVLYRRRARYDAAHLVGRSALGPASRARAGGLACLALDPALAPLDPASFLYVDTETTGLAGGTGTIAFLVGMARFEGDGFVLEQLLVRQPGEEAPALARFAEAVEAAGCLVSYNGKSFDLPLLRARFALNRLPPPPPRPHLDLVHVARRLHGKRLGRCSLRSIEGSVLGFERASSIESADVVGRYRAFLRTGEGALLDDVVVHNAADVMTLVALVALYDDPVASFCPADLVVLARTLSRAGAAAEALAVLEAASLRAGAGPDLLAARADAASALGDDAGAAEALGALLAERDEVDTRLKLAKLYEYGLGRPDEALRLVDRGTGEEGPALERRRRRLARKLAQQAQAALPGFETLVGPGARPPATRARRTARSVLALREGEQGRDLRLNALELPDGELNLGLAQPPGGVDEIE